VEAASTEHQAERPEFTVFVKKKVESYPQSYPDKCLLLDPASLANLQRTPLALSLRYYLNAILRADGIRQPHKGTACQVLAMCSPVVWWRLPLSGAEQGSTERNENNRSTHWSDAMQGLCNDRLSDDPAGWIVCPRIVAMYVRLQA
jgi:hypothetical protein